MNELLNIDNIKEKLNDMKNDKKELGIVFIIIIIIIIIGIIIGSIISGRKNTEQKIVLINYNSNNGTGRMDATECRKGSECILKNNTFNKEGYEFIGWSTSETEDNVKYKINDTYNATEDITLYAVWKLKEITITYDGNGGIGSMESTTYNYGDSMLILPENKYEKIGYTFNTWHIYNPILDKWYGCTDDNECNSTKENSTLGWHKRSDITTYYDNKIEWDTTKSEYDMIYYAQWGEDVYEIIYQLNGGTNGDESPISGVYGSTVTISNPTRDGFTFTGWTVEGTDAILNEKELTIGTSNITLTANWMAKMTDYIQYLYNEPSLKNANSLQKDTSNDSNIRYIGNNPNNYVMFNNELWRIIGIFNINGSNKVKLLRDSLLIDKASWDSSENTINSGQGINDWSQADIMYMLNEYYAGTDSTCQYCTGLNGSSWKSCNINCANNISKLNTTALNMIENITWKTGAVSFGDSNRNTFSNIYTTTAYSSERSTTTGKQCITNYPQFCSDTYKRTVTWTGKIGLIYPSDYGFASSNINCDLLEKNGECKKNNWMHINAPRIGVWTITPSGWWNFNNASTYIDNQGFIGMHFTHVPLGIIPAVYLKENIQISSGDGTKDNPYNLTI